MMLIASLLPSDFLLSRPMQVLAAFVAVNTLIYATLAFGAMLPRIYPRSWFTHRSRRMETRSIHPNAEK